MHKTINYYKEQLVSKIRRKVILDFIGESQYYSKTRKYSGKIVYNADEINQYIYENILEGLPFVVTRFGSTELQCCNIFGMNMTQKKEKAINQLCKWSGFFPNDISYGEEFSKLMFDCCSYVDVLGIWNLPFEHQYINTLLPNDACLSNIRNLEPWMSDNSWTASLAGKKVLVIHPFEATIKQQYFNNRQRIFPESNILPEFELITYKAVQTIAGTTDERFATWFEALDFMTKEITSIDFDVAILGCGAYGLPLACRIKNMGKQAIHLGGVTQILFGIKGSRWENDEAVAHLFNKYWIRPREDEKPKGANNVEGGCYW